ncbi:hypothetical protein EUX98_g8872 [Antrodiella citrinella]|uniref:Uncharacterized protein n=1 Tax=Antrodiella citrinella TaxID=2447956 RepID=A0A4S4M1P1_9APHY|nr:hypothetical protein EUX98_g8872 [Antrodiella citrinella]
MPTTSASKKGSQNTTASSQSPPALSAPSSATSGPARAPTPHTPLASTTHDNSDESAINELRDIITSSRIAQDKKEQALILIRRLRAALAQPPVDWAATDPTGPGRTVQDISPELTASIAVHAQRVVEDALRSFTLKADTVLNAHSRKTDQAIQDVKELLKNTPRPPAPSVSRGSSHTTPAQVDKLPIHCPRELEVVISLSKTDHKSETRRRSLADLKLQVEAALTKSGVARTEEKAKLILLHSSEWLTHFEPNALLEQKKYSIHVNLVPTSFDPKGKGAASSIYYDNQGTIPSPQSIVSARWLFEHQDSANKKSHASMVLTVAEEKTADTLIYRSLALGGTLCPVERYIPLPS